METNRFTLINYCLLFLLLILNQIGDITTKESLSIKQHNVIKSWADKIGVELWHVGELITRRKDVQESFKGAEVVPRNGERMIKPIAQELKYMFEQKIEAVKRIMESAENAALSFDRTEVIQNFSYYNSKEMLTPDQPEPANQTNFSLDDRSIKLPYMKPLRIELKENKRFFNTPVNFSNSSVHVPTNVFDRDNATLGAIQWSQELDEIFSSNYKQDPTLSWQFFGSATGFMRQFPASQWNDEFGDPVDLYDCRLRSWYIEAANSPKDIIILVDVSGSMTGQRKDIARNVVYNILDTLGTNDFVNIYKFSERTEATVPCFNISLVQASLANIRELKMSIEEMKTEAIAEYKIALTQAFEALQNHREEEHGANCNQAIMLISDGVPHDYANEIAKFNMQNNTYKPVRIFTYLIGKEVADVKKIKDMACSNLGYYVHLSTLAEVREQVLNYIHVMARPLVLGGEHPVIWTQAYADKTDPQMTDYSWELQERAEQKSKFENHRDRNKLQTEQKKTYVEEFGSGKYNLVITVAMPVYDKRKNATYIANLLGVAGTDIPIKEIQKFLSPFQLGVNGYGFLVTNNGFVLAHPDHRPVYRGILKPDYDSIDLSEVELLDDDSLPRFFHDKFIEFREKIVNQTNGSRFLVVKQHIDSMRRVLRLTRLYFWQPIENTPFTLVISYPHQYGLNRVKLKNEHDIHLLMTNGNVINQFKGTNWRIHPDWIYCRHNNKSFDSPEEELKFFLEKIKSGAWKWKDRTSHYSNASTGRKSSAYDKDSYYCDRELMHQLVFDAKVTQWFSNDRTGKEDKSMEKGSEKGQRFYELYNHAIDEVWYIRAVEQHSIDPQSFVFSVPFDVGTATNTLVTASHAIFLNDEMRSAPAAVVGYQFQLEALYKFFKNITSTCGDSRDSCDADIKCPLDQESQTNAGCYILDNNGYVVVAPDPTESGKFFGNVREWLMKRFVEENIYEKVTINNYQAVCEKAEKGDGNSGSILQGPIKHLISIFKWFGRVLTWAFIHLTMITPTYSYADYLDYDASTQDPGDSRQEPGDDKLLKLDISLIINRTRLQPCDKTIPVYTLAPLNKSIFNEPSEDCERPFVVVPIPRSNLILVVFNANNCPDDRMVIRQKISIEPEEAIYDAESLACYRLSYEKLLRRRPSSCINRHANESLIDQCGRAYSISMSITLIAFLIIVQALL